MLDCTSILLGTDGFNRVFLMPLNDVRVVVATPSRLTVARCNRGMVLLYHPTSPLEIYVDVESDGLAFCHEALGSYSRYFSYPTITLNRLYYTLCGTALH